MVSASDAAEREHLKDWTVQMGFRSNIISICRDRYYSNTCSYTLTGLVRAPETNPLLSLPCFGLLWQLSQPQIKTSISWVSPHCDQGKTDLWAVPGFTSLILFLWSFLGDGQEPEWFIHEHKDPFCISLFCYSYKNLCRKLWVLQLYKFSWQEINKD